MATEESLQKLLEALPYCQMNGEKVDCRFATRQNLAVFEAMANKRKPPLGKVNPVVCKTVLGFDPDVECR